MRYIRALLLTCAVLLLVPGSALWLGATVTPPQSSSPDATSREPEAGMFLVAKRGLSDPHFARTVVYLLMHNKQGTLGLVVNRPSGLQLTDAVPDIEDKVNHPHPLLYGGPVGVNVISMLLRNEKQTALVEHIADDVYVSADRTVLDRLLATKKPASELRFYLGHAGWTAGQLEQEMKRGDWHLVEGDVNAIFRANIKSLWKRLINKLEPQGLFV